METYNIIEQDITRERDRFDIINLIDPDKEFLTCNMEEGAWSYEKTVKSLVAAGKLKESDYTSADGRKYVKVDMRFTDGKVVVLVETKKDMEKDKNCVDQLRAYTNIETAMQGHKRIISILANLDNGRIIVWDGGVNDECKLTEERYLRKFTDYSDLYFGRVNDPHKVERCAYEMNELLESFKVEAAYRANLVSCCVNTLRVTEGQVDTFNYETMSAKNIMVEIKDYIETGLASNFKGVGDANIICKVFDEPTVARIRKEQYKQILDKLKHDLLPFINEKTTEGQDLLNLFYTVFNKYVGKKDKNQAFTPPHIVSFLTKAMEINKNSKVFDPCCGSGAFLVQALNAQVKDCKGDAAAIAKVKKNGIHGCELEEVPYSYSLTNLMLHDEVKACDNIHHMNCFDPRAAELLENGDFTHAMMNPPFNTQIDFCNPEDVAVWNSKKDKNGNLVPVALKDQKKKDPTKGFHFVKYVANKMKTGKLAVILPIQCAVGDDKDIVNIRELMLAEHRLDAMFTLPKDVFEPGATVASCVLIFTLGVRHTTNWKTFFGRFTDDGFTKKKHLNRVESAPGVWEKIEEKWLDLYFNRTEEKGLSVLKHVEAKDEWCPEAYMETDYRDLTDDKFDQAIRDFVGFKIQTSVNA